MTKFLTGALCVIAVGVLLIAYGLLNGRAAAFAANAGTEAFARPTLASERVMLNNDPYAGNPYLVRYPSASAYPPAAAADAGVAHPVRTSEVAQAPRRVARTEVVERAPKRDWRKTALVIGGSSAAAAGVGAIFGGKKGALIGAAIGGGASTLYEATKN